MTPVPAGGTVELRVGPVAHGGHCVARYHGQVVFVRYALPGELVRAVITEGVATHAEAGEGDRSSVAPRTADGSPAGGSRYLRADAVQVLEASVDRVQPPCPQARPGGCGGCDLQHVSPQAQRRWKADVVREQFSRLAGLGEHPAVRDLIVQPVPGDSAGLGWRTRARFAVTATGRPGMRRHRSHQIQELAACPLLHPVLGATGVLDRRWPGVSELALAGSVSTGRVVRTGDPEPGINTSPRRAPAGRRGPGAGDQWLTEAAAGRTWRVPGTGFWQVHPGAADTLVRAVRTALVPRPGEHLLDLYAGVGLFAGSLAGELGPTGRVDAVESDQEAVRAAKRNLHDLPAVRLHADRVDRWLRSRPVPRADLVVLDPPRAGAGRQVVTGIVALQPRAVAYVACDPAALARDVATFSSAGWRLTALTALDAFPMTHHVECVALLEPAEQRPPAGQVS